MAIRWPFQGTDAAPEQAPPLPPPRFAVGNRVTTRWGRATVEQICDWATLGGRAYQVRHAWSSAPPGFGHFFGEDDIELAGPEPATPNHEEEQEPAAAAPAPAQWELF